MSSALNKWNDSGSYGPDVIDTYEDDNVDWWRYRASSSSNKDIIIINIYIGNVYLILYKKYFIVNFTVNDYLNKDLYDIYFYSVIFI